MSTDVWESIEELQSVVLYADTAPESIEELNPGSQDYKTLDGLF